MFPGSTLRRTTLKIMMDSMTSSSSSINVVAAVVPTQSGNAEWRVAVEDTELRRSVLFRILVVLKARFGKVDKALASVARKIELELYSRASTRNEFSSGRTLIRRIYTMLWKLNGEHIHSSSGFMSRFLLLEKDHTVATAANATAPSSAAIITKKQRTNNTGMLSFPEGKYFSTLLPELMRLVLDFLPTSSKVALGLSSVGNFEIVKRSVVSIEFTSEFLAKTSVSLVSRILSRWEYVESLAVQSRKEKTKKTFFVSKDNMDKDGSSICSIAICNLMAAFRTRDVCMLSLKELILDDTFHDDMKDRLTRLISLSLCQLQAPKLEVISLDGNCISDDGARYLSLLFSSPALERISLQQNALTQMGVSRFQNSMDSFRLQKHHVVAGGTFSVSKLFGLSGNGAEQEVTEPAASLVPASVGQKRPISALVA